jgi:integrase
MKRSTAITFTETSDLAELAKRFLNASMAESSRICYRSDWKNFLDFCGSRGFAALPSDTDTICLFLSELVSLGRAVSTIVRSLTSINKAHEIAGFPSIRNPILRSTLKGIKRELGSMPRKMKGISYKEILDFAAHCDVSFMGVRDQAILMLGWCSALRRSELVALNIGDLEFCEQGVILSVNRSKTDQEGTGKKIAIPYALNKFCAVKSVKNWIERLPKNEQSPEKPLFRSVRNGGRRFWSTEVGPRLNDRMISLIVKKYAKLSGLSPDKYASHSLRRGLATEAGARRIPERIIARHTRHVSIAVLREYIEEGNIWIDNPLHAIYSPVPGPVTSFD